MITIRISGPQGSGKSTLAERIKLMLITEGKKVQLHDEVTKPLVKKGVEFLILTKQIQAIIQLGAVRTTGIVDAHEKLAVARERCENGR